MSQRHDPAWFQQCKFVSEESNVLLKIFRKSGSQASCFTASLIEVRQMGVCRPDPWQQIVKSSSIRMPILPLTGRRWSPTMNRRLIPMNPSTFAQLEIATSPYVNLLPAPSRVICPASSIFSPWPFLAAGFSYVAEDLIFSRHADFEAFAGYLHFRRRK